MSVQVKILYSYIDGAHFFTSPEVKGLCAASVDFDAAFDAVEVQLAALLDGCMTFHPPSRLPRAGVWTGVVQQ